MNSKRSTIFITGITSGIGYEILQICLEKNFHVTAVIRHDSQKNQFKDISSENLSLYVADLSKKEPLQKVAQSLKFKSFDYILLNAGCARIGLFHQLPEESIDEIMEVNVLGTMRLVHAFLPQSIKDGTKFIFVSSLVARLPASRYATYATSKAALSKFVESVRREYKEVSFLLVEIGAVDTPLHSKANNVGVNKRHFKSPRVIAQRLFKAMLNKTGTVTLSLDWALIRKLAMIVGL